MRSTGSSSTRLSSHAPALPRDEATEVARVVEAEDARHAVPEPDGRDGGRVDDDPLEEIRMGAGEVGEEQADHVAVGDGGDGAPGVRGGDPLDRAERALLRFEEALAVGEPRSRGRLLDD